MKNTTRFNQAMIGWLLHTIMMIEIFRYIMEYSTTSERFYLFSTEYGVLVSFFAGFVIFVVMSKDRD